MLPRGTVNFQASQDFDKARAKEFFSRVLHFLRPQRNQLLNFNEVKTLLRPNAEIYRGMQTINIDNIVGSEGRYRDFNAVFLPRNEYMRSRWESVDKAHIQDVILPPIKLYKVGDAYFVRDGNHRVSVARSQGVLAIDAEVTEFKTDYKLEHKETIEELRDKLLNYERERFIEQTHLDQIIPLEHLEFSAPGRFDEVLEHIQGHKYFINLNITEEISFQDAALSWYYNVFLPTIQTISHEGVMARFPGRTKADLYIWIVKHWNELKGKYGEKVSLKDAALDFSHRRGKSLWQQFRGLFKK